MGATQAGAAGLIAEDPAARAVWLPFERGELVWPAQGRALFLGARADAALAAHASPATPATPAAANLVCQQDFRPFADVLERNGMPVSEPAPEDHFALVMLLPPRQRELRKVMLARAIGHVADGGTLLAAVANREGARSARDDLERLAGPTQHLTKHKCRVFWLQVDVVRLDEALRHEWLAHDALRRTVDGLVSRPGLFAWDRVDPGSALLAERLPDDLAGRVADLGAGAGYLSVQLVRRCPRVTSIDLFEADARALPAARINLERACEACAREVTYTCHWHDVATGLPATFDHIVSNPPFHQGRAAIPQLGRAFIAAAAAALRPGGTFRMVANRHLAYEATLREQFAQVRMVAERDGYKVLEAHR